VKKNTKHTEKGTVKIWLYYLIIAVIGFILYGQSINNDFNIDDDYVYENHQLVQKGISGIPEIFKSRYNTRDEQYFGYRPLTIAIYAIEYEIFGSNPHTAHFFNILYYIISCLLLFYLLRQLLKDKFPEGYIWISFLIVIIFQTHAIHTEVVLSIKNREEIISLIFSLVASIYAIKFFEKRKALNIIIAVISLSIAFLAKESAVAFAVIIPLIIVFFKTNIKFLSKFEILSKISFNNPNTIIKAILIILMLVFISINGELTVFKDRIIRLHNYNTGSIEFIIWFIFILIYTYILIRNRKTEKKIQITKRNISLWIIAGVSLILTVIGGSQVFGLLVLIALFLTTFVAKKSTPIKVQWLENVSSKTIITISVFVALSGIVLAIVYYVPKQSLPETNAPVYKWQNPSFAEGSSMGNKAAVAIYSLGYYSKLMVIPYPLRFYYGYKMVPDVKMTDILVIFSLLFHLFLLFIALRNFNKRSLLSFGILFYLIAIFPFSNTFFPLTGIIA